MARLTREHAELMQAQLEFDRAKKKRAATASSGAEVAPRPLSSFGVLLLFGLGRLELFLVGFRFLEPQRRRHRNVQVATVKYRD
jgi:hypothetical protein